MTGHCRHVHILKGVCTLPQGHPGDHAWRNPEAQKFQAQTIHSVYGRIPEVPPGWRIDQKPFRIPQTGEHYLATGIQNQLVLQWSGEPGPEKRLILVSEQL